MTSEEKLHLNRRTILLGGAAVALVTAARRQAERLFGRIANANVIVPDLSQGADEYFTVVREDDALVLSFRLYNMKLVRPIGGEPYLTQIGTTNESTSGVLVVDFPIQAIGEQAVIDDGSSADAGADPTKYNRPPAADTFGGVAGYWAHSVTGGQPTRLVFEIPGNVTRIRPSLQSTATTPGLLAWTHFTPLICDGITADPQSYTGPNAFETSIGAPFGLALSPEPAGRWLHSEQPVTLAGRTELWQTRLGGYTPPAGALGISELAEFPTLTPEVRAVYSDGFKRTVDPDSITPDSDFDGSLPLTVADRAELVMLTSDHTQDAPTNASSPTYLPTPLEARRLMLTSGGAWLDLHGSWSARTNAIGQPGTPTYQPGLNVTSWTHVATQGRDEHVVVTYLGYLMPFGHGAVLVKEVQRRFEASPTGTPVANLRLREYIVISKQDRAFGPGSDNPFLANEGRDFPFRRVRINTRVTPNLLLKHLGTPPSHLTNGAAFCYTGATPFQFNVSAWDWEGRKVDFTVPMAFVTAPTAQTEDGGTALTSADPMTSGTEHGQMWVVRLNYNQSAVHLRTADLHNAKVAVAPSLVSGDTTARFDSMTFRVAAPILSYDGPMYDSQFAAHDLMRGNPSMDHGSARIPSVQTVSPGATSKVAFDDDYVTGDFGTGAAADEGSVFLQVAGQSLNFTPPPTSANAGLTSGRDAHPGVATPNMSVGGISRTRGVIGGVTNNGSGGVDQYKSGQFAPEAFLEGAKLLGGLALWTIIKATGILESPIPEFKTVQIYPDGPDGQPDTTQSPTGVRTSLDWSPTIQDSDGLPVFHADPGASFTLQIKAEASYVGGDPTAEVSGSLRNFTLNMFGDDPFIILQFNEFSFHARNGAKPTVVPDIQKVTFGGALSFVNDLQSLLSTGDGSGITVTPTQVSAQYTLAIPSVGIGIFSLTNLSFSAGIDIPFIDKPARVRFSFCTREKPFLISVMIFGGGGFVGLALGSDGMELLEISLEFGAHIGIDVCVASGSIEIMAGIYFAVGKNSDPTIPGEMVQLTGFVKAHGELNFGPVGVALTFMLSLNYKKDNGKSTAWGTVQVHLEVHVLVFSGSVDFTAQKQFGGGNDPNFGDTLAAADFNDYALAFA